MSELPADLFPTTTEPAQCIRAAHTAMHGLVFQKESEKLAK